MVTPLKKVPIHLQSAQNRLLIKNGTVVNDDGSEQMDVYVEDMRIKQMGNHLIIPGGTRVIDATGKYIMPGGIDANVHFEMPYSKDEANTRTIDNFYQGTKAALAGGTTTVVDCVMPGRDESLIEAYNKWRGWADEKACCDYGLRVALPNAVTESVLEELNELTGEEFGVNTVFITMEGDSRINDEDMLRAFEAVGKAGCVAQVHAESGDLVERNAKAMLAKGVTGPEGHAMAHTDEAEEEAVMRASTLAGQVNCPVYFTSLTGSTAVDIVKAKRARGNVVYAEVTAAGLAVDGSVYWDQSWNKAASCLTSPPFRKNGPENLLKLAAAGHVDALSSDHKTFNSHQKALGRRDFTKVPPGVNGVGERMMILWDKLVSSQLAGPEAFVALTSANPAKLFNMYPDKGRVAVGSQADLVIWDPKGSKVISAEDDNLKGDANVFEGMSVCGLPDTVIMSGRIVVDEGQLRVMQGFGRFLPLPPFAPQVYEKVRAREADMRSMNAVIRTMEDTNGNGGDIPLPTPVRAEQPERAPSQQDSNFDLKSHPNAASFDNSDSTPNKKPSVRVKAPPGGRSSGGFW